MRLEARTPGERGHGGDQAGEQNGGYRAQHNRDDQRGLLCLNQQRYHETDPGAGEHEQERGRQKQQEAALERQLCAFVLSDVNV